jgi:dimethylargininase
VLTRPGAVSRTGEVASMAQALDPCFSSLETIKEPGTLDGGDVCEAGNHYFVGISERTNEEGARQLGERLLLLGRSYSLVDVRGVSGLLHLKSGIAYLGDNRLAVIKSLAGRKEFASYELVHVDPGEEYAANCVRVNHHLLIARGYPGFAASATKLGYQTIELEMTEFQKMDGGLSCLSLRF